MKDYKQKTICLLLIGLVAGLGLFAGCTPEQRSSMEKLFKTDKTRFLDPSRPIKAPEYASIMPILTSVSVVDSSQVVFPNATRPTEDDMSYSAADYIMGPGDVLDIGVMDLFTDGIETVLRRQVSDSGFIDLPLIDKIKAEGLTQQQFKEAIINAYSANVLQSPEVSVSILAASQSTYSIRGAIARPAVYNVTGNDMRLIEALALAGGITQANIRYIYVFRQLPPTRLDEEKATTGKSTDLKELDKLPELPPETPSKEVEKNDNLEELQEILVPKSEEKPAEPEPKPEDDSKPISIYMLSETSSVAGSGPAGATSPKTKAYKWVYSNGRWVRVAQDADVAEKPSGEGAAPVRPAGDEPKSKQTFEGSERSVVEPKAKPEQLQKQPAGNEDDPFGWKHADKSNLGRIIAIDLRKLDSGDPRMNIVIRDKDAIRVPTLEIGEFYVIGEVFRPGVYNLTGRSVTIKQALAASGGLGPLAWPSNTILIRRIGDNQEQNIPVDLEAIMRGEEPDLLLKPNDVLAIGSDVRAPFMAVVRNAFRMTYGFGFIYDRNFADPYLQTLDNKRFTRW